MTEALLMQEKVEAPGKAGARLPGKESRLAWAGGLHEFAAQRMPLAAQPPLTQAMPFANNAANLAQRQAEPEEEEEIQTKACSGSIQREAAPEEEEEIQTKGCPGLIQREAAPEEEEEIQTKGCSGSIQREAAPEEEEEIQTKGCPGSIQREAAPEEEEEIQTKLVVGPPDDEYEREADRVAEQVVSMPEPKVQRVGEEEEEELQTKPLAGQITPLVQRQPEPGIKNDDDEPIQTKHSNETIEDDEDSLQNHIENPSCGRPLMQNFRRDIETVLNKDFSYVKVHDSSGDRADADMLNAKAFTRGSDIWIGSAGSADDRKLIAHELAHVVQQNSAQQLSKTVVRRNGTTTPSNLQSLDEMLSRLNVPEEEVIELLGHLNPTEKTAVLSGGYQGKMGNAFNVREMVRAVNILNPDLATKLRWVESAAIIRKNIDYADIRGMITAVTTPQTDKNALKTIRWQRFFVDVCNNATMLQAVRDLGFDLKSKLEWIQAEITSVRTELSYADIKDMITAAPQPERNELKTAQWLNFFIRVCTNTTIAEAVDDLGWDLVTKLDWMMAEGTNYMLASQKIISSSVTEKASALSDHAFLRRLMNGFGWDDFAKFVELLGRHALAYNALIADPTVDASLRNAWTESDPSVPGPATTQHEEGGWIYLNLISGGIFVRRQARGRSAAINLNSPPIVAESIVIGKFHTHPNLGPNWLSGPSTGPRGDTTVDASHGVPDIVIGCPHPPAIQYYQSGPNQRLHLAGNQGLPGASGGIAPQAKVDGSYDEQ